MQLVIHKLILVLVILAGCSPILKPMEKQSQNLCSEEITGSFLQAKMYQQYIVLEQENSNFIVYDLTQQTTNCDIEKSDNLLFLFGPEEAKKMANGLRLSAASDPQMTIKSFSKKNASFQKLVEDKCEQMKLNFVFGLETEEGPVIGCQTSPKSKSAIMFKQNKKDSNKIEVAFLSFYEPLVERFIN